MTTRDLESVTQALVAKGKGILAADDTIPTLRRRFDILGVRSTEQRRRTYREVLFTAPGAAEFIGGVFTYDETIHQKSAGGPLLAEALVPRGSFPALRSTPARRALASTRMIWSWHRRAPIIHRIAAVWSDDRWHDGTTVSTRRRDAQFNDTAGGNNGSRAIPKRAIID
jgi:hypothetical protein